MAGGSRPLDVEQIASSARLLVGLPRYLRHPVRPMEARAILRHRLEHREQDFLRLVRRAVYANAASPYRQLLRLAACEYGDLERLVGSEGVEGALCTLFQRGVYLTVEEFKGRRPAVRGSSTVALATSRLRNPYTAFHLMTQTSGSRGKRTVVPIDLANLRDRAVNACLHFEARGGSDWVQGLWGIPGGWSMVHLLQCSSFGSPPHRWFTQIDMSAPGLPARYLWSARVVQLGSALAGVRLPSAKYVSPDEPLAIADWLISVIRSGRIPHLYAFASAAVRLCQAAFDAGLDLTGAQLMLTAETTTPARLAAVRQTGAEAVSNYGSSETGFIGYGCLAAEVADDVHLFQDVHAVVQPGSASLGAVLPPKALLVTSLRDTAPLILLNVSLGDQATMTRRSCGCPQERLGWPTHLHTISSHEKLTVGGLTVLDADVIRILEQVLPARFGGGLADYQLLDQGGSDGQVRLRLLVDPSVGAIDVEALREAFIAEISTLPGGSMTPFLWRAPGLLCVERRRPVRTATGKIHHVHFGGEGGGGDPPRLSGRPR